MNALIYFLNFLFMLAILVWALFAYTEIWIYHNIRQTFKTISKLLRSELKPPPKTPLDYLITQGLYKGRKAVCRINRHPSSKLLHYSLSLHFHIEPLIKPRQRFPEEEYLIPKPQSHQDNRIYYQSTSSTSIISYIFTNKISEQEITNIFEELTHAAEIVEANFRNGKLIL